MISTRRPFSASRRWTWGNASASSRMSTLASRSANVSNSGIASMIGVKSAPCERELGQLVDGREVLGGLRERDDVAAGRLAGRTGAAPPRARGTWRAPRRCAAPARRRGRSSRCPRARPRGPGSAAAPRARPGGTRRSAPARSAAAARRTRTASRRPSASERCTTARSDSSSAGVRVGERARPACGSPRCARPGSRRPDGAARSVRRSAIRSASAADERDLAVPERRPARRTPGCRRRRASGRRPCGGPTPRAR